MAECNARFYVCKVCGNLVGMIRNGGGELVCCGQPMEHVCENTVDAAVEKHIPIVKREGSKLTVTVGEVLHPMEEKHFIEWIYVETKNGGQRVSLKPGQEPVAEFCVEEDPIAVYAYCNLHGLWRA